MCYQLLVSIKNQTTCFAVLIPCTMACRCTSQSSCSSLTYFLRARFRFWLVRSSFTIKIQGNNFNTHSKHTKIACLNNDYLYPFLCFRDFCDNWVHTKHTSILYINYDFYCDVTVTKIPKYVPAH